MKSQSLNGSHRVVPARHPYQISLPGNVSRGKLAAMNDNLAPNLILPAKRLEILFSEIRWKAGTRTGSSSYKKFTRGTFAKTSGFSRFSSASSDSICIFYFIPAQFSL